MTHFIAFVRMSRREAVAIRSMYEILTVPDCSASPRTVTVEPGITVMYPRVEGSGRSTTSNGSRTKYTMQHFQNTQAKKKIQGGLAAVLSAVKFQH
jgi:hypothetical protein